MIDKKTQIRSVNGCVSRRVAFKKKKNHILTNQSANDCYFNSTCFYKLPEKAEIILTYDCIKDRFSYNCSTKRFLEIMTRLNAGG